MRVGVIQANGERLADRYWAERFVQDAAEKYDQRIYFLLDCWENFFESVKYKPRWEFDYYYDIDFDQEKVHIDMRVPDVYHPETLIRVHRMFHLHPWVSQQDARDLLRSLIRELEMHEVDENITIDGERVFDPHKNEVNA